MKPKKKSLDSTRPEEEVEVDENKDPEVDQN